MRLRIKIRCNSNRGSLVNAPGFQWRGASQSLPIDFECKCACASGEHLPLGGTERDPPYYSTSPMASCALGLRARADGEIVGNIRCSTSSRNTNW
jgi:hypothetical protein